MKKRTWIQYQSSAGNLGAASLGSEAPEPMCRPLDDKWRRVVGEDLVGFPSNPRTEHRSMHHHRILNCMSIDDASFSHTNVLTNSPRSISNSATHNPQPTRWCKGTQLLSLSLSLSFAAPDMLHIAKFVGGRLNSVGFFGDRLKPSFSMLWVLQNW